MYEFNLVAESGALRFSGDGYRRVWHLLRDRHSAVGVDLPGQPKSVIRVRASGTQAELPPELLAEVEALAGTRLRYEYVASDLDDDLD